MRKRLVPTIIIIITIGIIGVLISGLSEKVSANPGDTAFDYTLKDMYGKEHKLSDSKGKIVVLNFFATWCQPCIDEAPELEAFGAEYKNAELFIIAKGETTKRMNKYIEESNSKLSYLLDTTEDVSKKYNVIGQPETIIIDENGIIVERFSGPTTKEHLIELIENIHNSQD
ncbi:TlpA family protein disulfide reductase [Cytobacillus dafuensis]|uniref:TlpA family protein disulfide reductase n=1 Tax=Cytobacillus dafuensis TaxID=1742359 RepID=A0A5B8Z7C9_CYTDA|nr:TlpA disulfide reductase family protein [Cytobacillus dafuensis]QED49025.1 TlpA family protein disulfide reductase [Cytobacillus dafuensis]